MSIAISCKAPSKAQMIFKSHSKKEFKNRFFFDDLELGSGGSEGHFLINTRFSECGEWGGHLEEMKIIAKPSDSKFYLNYLKTEINCESYVEGKGFAIDTTVTKTIALSRKSKKAILNYLEKLAVAKITSRFPGYFGNIYEARKSDSTFVLQVYDSRKSTLKAYQRMLKKLNL